MKIFIVYKRHNAYTIFFIINIIILSINFMIYFYLILLFYHPMLWISLLDLNIQYQIPLVFHMIILILLHHIFLILFEYIKKSLHLLSMDLGQLLFLLYHLLFYYLINCISLNLQDFYLQLVILLHLIHDIIHYIFLFFQWKIHF